MFLQTRLIYVQTVQDNIVVLKRFSTKEQSTKQLITAKVNDANDSTNTINDLENQNKLLKNSIVCRRSTKLLHQYMALHFYRQNVLTDYKDDLGSQIMTFLLDIKKVYPGYVNGELSEGVHLKEIDPPTAESEDFNFLKKQNKKNTIEEEINETPEEDDDSYSDLF